MLYAIPVVAFPLCNSLSIALEFAPLPSPGVSTHLAAALARLNAYL
jgi:hypothetical protein